MIRRLILASGIAALCGTTPAAAFELHSPDVPANGMVPMANVYDAHDCGGGNRSPALAWSGAPARARSFAVTVFDTDARGGAGWWHWLVIDIPATIRGLPANAGATGGAQLPAGALPVRNSFGSVAYGGPCPPPGDAPHHYVFTVYALKTPRLALPADAATAAADAAIRADAIATARFTARYGR